MNSSDIAHNTKNPKFKLWQQVLFAMIIGVITGLYFREKTEVVKPLGIMFINLIKMIIVPLIFFSIIAGITGMSNSSSVSRVGFKSIVAFLITSIFAVTIGITTAEIIKPGIGTSFEFLTGVNSISEKDLPSVIDIILNIFPSNIFAAMTEGNILQIIVFSFFCGYCLNSMRERCKLVIDFCQQAAQLSFKMIEIIVKLAPIGVFGYMAWSVGTQGFGVVASLGKLVVVILIACFFQYLMFGVFISLFAKLNPIPFYKKMIEPQALAFSSSSSKATLSTTMRVLHNSLGVSKNSTNFVLPIGSSINMDGGAIYLGVCCIFFAQSCGLELKLMHYAIITFMCTLGSIGAAGIPGGIMLFLGMALTSVGLPLEAVAIVAGVDRILDMVTTAVNVTGDSCVTLIIDETEETLDKKIYYS